MIYDERNNEIYIIIKQIFVLFRNGQVINLVNGKKLRL